MTAAQDEEVAWRELIRARVDRPERLEAVAATGLLDTELEVVFDRLTGLAGAVLGAPWVFVTLVDERRSFWKSCFGVEATAASDRQNTVGESFCQYVVATGDTFLIDDAREDARTKDNPSIASMGVVAWAGCPLRSASGEVLGTFCAVDNKARHWTPADADLLETLAGAASSEIQLRTALAEAQSTTAQLTVQLQQRDDIGRRSLLLAKMAQELSAAESSSDVATLVSERGRALLSAHFVNVHIADPSGSHLSVVHSRNLPPEIVERFKRIPIDGASPGASAVLERQPVTVSTFDEYAARWPSVADAARAAGVGAAAAWPLLRSDGSVLGAMSIGWADSVEFGPLIRSALSTVAQMTAGALERAQAGDARKGFVVALQHALLPKLPSLPGLDVAARYLPANNELGFGGDWYDVVAISPTQTAVIVGDVCGHGISAAATMAQLRGSINALTRQSVDALDGLFESAEQWMIGPSDFVATVAVHLIDETAGTVRYVSAGHPPSILVRPDGSTALLTDGRRPVLGMGGRPVSVGQVSFEPGSLLVAYTDGLVERRNRSFDDGVAGVASTVASMMTAKVEEIAGALEDLVTWSATDDVAIIVVRCRDA